MFEISIAQGSNRCQGPLASEAPQQIDEATFNGDADLMSERDESTEST